MKRILSSFLAAIMITAVFTSCTSAPSVPTDTGHPSETETVTPSNLIISEVMPDNEKLCLGHDLDWVELYNREETAVSLNAYYLTDDPKEPYAMSLTGLQIPAEGYLTVVLEEDAPFHLSSEGESIYLTCQGNIIAQLTYPLSEHGESYSADGVCEFPTPGYANTEDGYRSYLESLPLPELIITEILPSNSLYLPVNDEYYDVVEVKNNSDTPLDLSQYTLTDKRKEPARFTFPSVTLAPGEYYIVYCSGSPSLGENHTSFKISASGETVYLAKEGKITDVLTVPGDLKENESYGRDGKIPVYLLFPTPGTENSTGYRHGLAAPTAGVSSGIYDKEVTVPLDGPGTIYYTLDGSRPTTESPVYTEPIPVDGVTTIRTFCADGERSSALTAYTYVIGQQHDLPVVTVSIPQDLLTGETGILNHIDVTYEYEAVCTLLEGGEEKFSVPFGFRLHGNGSRDSAKQNFQLRFRSEYGMGKLKYALFDNRNIDEYNSLLLKGGSEDWNSAVMRDEVGTAIVDGTTNLYAQAMKPVVLYLGGEYWGIYYLRERFSDDYAANHLGVSEDSVDLLYSSGAYVQSGSAKDYRDLLTYVKNNDLTAPENYAYLTERIDVVSLMDWYICRSYMGDKDLANIRRFRSSESDGKWRWMYFDLDWGFWHTADKPVSGILQNSNGDHVLINAVLQNAQGRDAFLRRYAELMKTILNEEYITGVIDSVAASIESEIPRDRERWGTAAANWNNAVNRLRNYVKDGARTQHVLADIRKYFALSDEQMQTYFGA